MWLCLKYFILKAFYTEFDDWHVLTCVLMTCVLMTWHSTSLCMYSGISCYRFYYQPYYSFHCSCIPYELMFIDSTSQPEHCQVSLPIKVGPVEILHSQAKEVAAQTIPHLLRTLHASTRMFCNLGSTCAAGVPSQDNELPRERSSH